MKDVAEADRLFRAAAEGGSIDGMRDLARNLAVGNSVARDEAAAASAADAAGIANSIR